MVTRSRVKYMPERCISNGRQNRVRETQCGEVRRDSAGKVRLPKSPGYVYIDRCGSAALADRGNQAAQESQRRARHGHTKIDGRLRINPPVLSDRWNIEGNVPGYSRRLDQLLSNLTVKRSRSPRNSKSSEPSAGANSAASVDCIRAARSVALATRSSSVPSALTSRFSTPLIGGFFSPNWIKSVRRSRSLVRNASLSGSPSGIRRSGCFASARCRGSSSEPSMSVSFF